jgi:hypothetical protein
MQVINMIIGGINNVIYGKPGADAEIENVIQSIRAAGKWDSRSSNTTSRPIV